MASKLIDEELSGGMLSQEQVSLRLARINKIVKKLLSEDVDVRSKAVAINPFGGKLAGLRDRIFLFDDFLRDCQVVQDRCRQSESVFLELCSGSGGHLIGQSQQNEKSLLFGVELRFKRTVRTIEKAIKEDIENLLMLRTDAELIANIFARGSLDGVWVNFPDPWAKENEQKHRVLNSDFLERMDWLLKKDGFVSIRTDHQGYFDDFSAVALKDERFIVSETSRDFHRSEFALDSVRTEFESLFLSQGLPIYYLKLMKRG